MPARIQAQLLKRQRVGIALGACPAQQGTQPRLELAHVEWLDQVVVGPGIQAVNAIAHRLACCEHQDRHPVALAAQPAAHLKAIDAGHADVEHHRFGGGPYRLVERLVAVLGQFYLVSAQRERATKGVAYRAIVIDHQDPHAPIVPARRADR